MSIPPERLESYALSPIQQGMYYDSLLSSPGIYLLQILLTLREPVEPARLWEALQQVTARHSVLRTAFQPGEDGMISQVVYHQVEVPKREIDLRGQPAGQQEIEIERLVREEHLRGMDLDQAPLMRASLILLGPDENQLLLTIYHAVVDSRSFMLVLRELFTIYDALRAKGTRT